MAKQSRLELKLEPTELFCQVRERLASGIEELAEEGETLSGDQLRELAEDVRAIGLSAS